MVCNFSFFPQLVIRGKSKKHPMFLDSPQLLNTSDFLCLKLCLKHVLLNLRACYSRFIYRFIQFMNTIMSFYGFLNSKFCYSHPSFGGKIPNSSAVRRALCHASWHTALPSVTRHLGVPPFRSGKTGWMVEMDFNGLYNGDNVNPGLINCCLLIRGGYSSNSHFIWYLNGILPIKQPFGVY